MIVNSIFVYRHLKHVIQKKYSLTKYKPSYTIHYMPEQTRRIFEMSRFENKTVKEIAEETNITAKGVEYHITKALKVLRINLKDYLPLFYFLFS